MGFWREYLKDKSNLMLLIKLIKSIAVKNPSLIFLFLTMILLDGLLVAFMSTVIIPIADYFIDPNLVKISSVTSTYLKYIKIADLTPGIEIFLSILVFSYFIKALTSTAVNYLNRKIAYFVSGELTCNILDAFMTTSLLFYLLHPLGLLQNTLQREVNQLCDGILAILKAIATLIQMLLLLYLVWMLSSRMLIICSLMAFLFLVFTKQLNHLLIKYSEHTTNTGNILTQSLIEILTGAKIILAYGRGRIMLERFKKNFESHSYFAVISQTFQSGIPVFYQAFGIFSVSFSLYVSINNNENMPTVLAALWTLMRIVPLFSELIGNFTNILTVTPSFIQYRSILVSADNYLIKSGKTEFLGIKSGISLNNVYFKYSQRGLALSNVNLFIPRGSFTAFVGESGSGKTTTADLLLKLLTPSSGNVCIDSMSLLDYETSSFLDRVGYVPQESFLFNATIRENLLWSLPNSTDEDIWSALRRANIDQFVSEQPLGLDTMVGDRGVSLSGGQRQRVALARALLKKPDILIMDEATSALDSDSERQIMQSIDSISPFTTIVVIAHRLSTVVRADQVCVFSAGRVVETGTYAKLSKDPNSHLGKLVAAQKLS